MRAATSFATKASACEYMQVADFMGDGTLVATELRHLARALHATKLAGSSSEAQQACCALLDLPSHYQQAVYQHLFASFPLPCLLRELPQALHLPLLPAMLISGVAGMPAAGAQADALSDGCLNLSAPADPLAPRAAGGVAAPLDNNTVGLLTAQIPLLRGLRGLCLAGHALSDAALVYIVQSLAASQRELTHLDVAGSEADVLALRALSVALPRWPRLADRASQWRRQVAQRPSQTSQSALPRHWRAWLAR
jgi:hypothetical protein